MAQQLFRNNFDWQLIGPVTAGTHVGFETTIGRGILQITDAASARLGTLTGGDWYVLTLYKRSGSVESDIEIIKVLGVNEVGYAAPGECRIRVERGHEGTTPQTYVANDLVSMRLTAGGLNDLASDAELATKEPAITAGTTAQFWRGDKTWQDLFTQVRAATLTGLSTATSTVIAAADTVLVALGKLQAQVSLKLNAANPSFTGNLTASGTAQRITGDFSNETVVNRLLFQSSTINGITAVTSIPNGTSQSSFFQAINSSAPANASTMQIAVSATESQLSASRTGGGTYLPMTFYAGGSARMGIDTSGNVGIGTSPTGNRLSVSGTTASGYGQTAVYPPPAFIAAESGHATSRRASYTLGSWAILQDINGVGVKDFGIYASGGAGLVFLVDPAGNTTFPKGAFGYGAGAGGYVAQPTSVTTGVTINKPSMTISTFRQAWTANEERSFLVTNSFVDPRDTVSVSLLETGMGAGWLCINTLVRGTPGSFYVSMRNVTGGALADTQIAFQLDVIKGSST